MEGPTQVVCVICKNSGHTPSSCPELSEPLKSGFYSGGGGYSGGEDED